MQHRNGTNSESTMPREHGASNEQGQKDGGMPAGNLRNRSPWTSYNERTDNPAASKSLNQNQVGLLVIAPMAVGTVSPANTAYPITELDSSGRTPREIGNRAPSPKKHGHGETRSRRQTRPHQRRAKLRPDTWWGWGKTPPAKPDVRPTVIQREDTRMHMTAKIVRLGGHD